MDAGHEVFPLHSFYPTSVLLSLPQGLYSYVVVEGLHYLESKEKNATSHNVPCNINSTYYNKQPVTLLIVGLLPHSAPMGALINNHPKPTLQYLLFLLWT
jgi:hypothetical protein